MYFDDLIHGNHVIINFFSKLALSSSFAFFHAFSQSRGLDWNNLLPFYSVFTYLTFIISPKNRLWTCITSYTLLSFFPYFPSMLCASITPSFRVLHFLWKKMYTAGFLLPSNVMLKYHCMIGQKLLHPPGCGDLDDLDLFVNLHSKLSH